MSSELEAAALDSGVGWLRWKRRHADIPPGTPCANCETPLMGTYCHACGQLAEDFHRSTWHLLVEAVESMLHLDGKLFRTLPGLVRDPGKLTRDYLEGKRAFQVQPFRMFLVILLLVLFVGHWAGGVNAAKTHAAEAAGAHAPTSSLTIKGRDGLTRRVDTSGDTAADKARARAQIEADPDLTPEARAAALAAIDGDWASFGRSFAPGGANFKPAAENRFRLGGEDEARSPRMAAIEKWGQARYDAVREDPERFALLLEIWGHRIAVLALPVSALMLTLLFIFNRRFYVFDHLVFSMHSLSFQMLLLTTIFFMSTGVGAQAWWLILAAPLHLYAHLKGCYQRSWFGTVARMAALFVMTTVTFSLLALLWLYLGFNEMAGGGH